LSFELSIAFQTDKTPADYLRLGKFVDRYGFDVVSVYNDLYFQPALGPLLHLAQVVSKARLGPAALNPFTTHPVEIAGQVAVLDQATDGRAYLGLARGAWLSDIGIVEDRPVRRLRECIEVVRYLLAGSTEGFQGDIYRIEPGKHLLYPVRRKHVPIMLGTWGQQTARAVGHVVDEVKIGGTANPDMVRQMRQWLPPQVGICVGAVTVVDRDGEAARTLARREVAPYLDVVGQLDPTVAAPTLERFAFAGTPDDIVHQVQQLRDAGASRVEFGTPHGLDPETGIRLLGEEVLPRICP
jgi:5,10-methylenetetrahydromethanopterin reductase